MATDNEGRANYAALAKQAKAKVAIWEAEWRDIFEERAAIREYEGGVDRPQAEWLAYREVVEMKKADEQ